MRSPTLWRLFRPFVRRQFDSIAPVWDSMRLDDTLAPYEAALDRLPAIPARVLDVGTGTGAGALMLASRFPEATVVGVDLSDAMLAQARRNTPAESRITYERADASALPFPDASFDLVAHANMIPFFDEVARVVVPGGHALFAFSSGAGTPIYVAPERLRQELAQRGFTDFAEVQAARGNALLARKAHPA